ncbi:MAG: hypothetical protein WC679_12810 [Bacteroidales bacterium]|jgi:hypothetical protein
MKYDLTNIDLCNSQYFRGHHLPVVQVLVDENTTYKDVKLALLDTYSSIDHLEDIDTEAYVEAVNAFFENFTSLDYVPDSFCDIGSAEENEEHDVYMYFVIETVEED